MVGASVCQAATQRLVGVNLSGPELNPGAVPGKEGTDYIYPDAATMRHFAALGATCVRLPVLWERLQPALNHALAKAELARVDDAIAAARANGLRLILDLHNYGRWRGAMVGDGVSPAAFAQFWLRLAKHVNSLPGGGATVFGLMNEPHDIAAGPWEAAEQSAIDAIRRAGAKNLILASGTDWDGAHSVLTDGNAASLQSLHDPDGALAIELHQYLDADSSGTSVDCVTPRDAAARLQPATDWLRTRHLHGFLGEFAASAKPSCLASLDALLSVLDRNRDVWIGWTDWAAGPWWGNYMFSVQPKDGKDAPQTGILVRHMVAAR
jgi:endoglucanase